MISNQLDKRENLCGLGLDIGGTKIAAGLVRQDGTVLETHTIPTGASRGGDVVMGDALQLARGLIDRAQTLGRQVAAIGLGVCELVDPDGQVISQATLPWRGFGLQREFEALAPSRVLADSRAAAFGEAACGAGVSFGSFLYVTVGTGIGSSWVWQGVPFVGRTGCTGTLASSPTTVLCSECGELRRAVLEEISSGSGLVRRYNEKTGAQVASAEAVLAAAESGDAAAQSVIDTAVECLGSTLGLLVNVLDPEAIVVGGGLGSAPGHYWNRLAPSIRRAIWSEVHRDLPIVQAKLGRDSGVIGAALLAWHSLSRI